MPRANKGKAAKNPRTSGSAAAFAGCIGLPDGSGRLMLHDGGLEKFCATFNRVADQWLATRSVECRNFVRAEREARAL